MIDPNDRSTTLSAYAFTRAGGVALGYIGELSLSLSDDGQCITYALSGNNGMDDKRQRTGDGTADLADVCESGDLDLPDVTLSGAVQLRVRDWARRMARLQGQTGDRR